MGLLSTHITTWVAESILYETDTRRRAAMIKHVIKMAEKCLQLLNYDTLMSILAALNSTAIERLRRTWEGVPNRSKLILAELRRQTDHSRNYAEYRAKLRLTMPPCIPFFGLYLTDLVFTDDGNPDVRRQLIPDTDPSAKPIRIVNFDKHAKAATIIRDLQRFQSPYPLTPSPDLQEYLQGMWLNSRSGGDPSTLYKASEEIEPREEEARFSRPQPPGHDPTLAFA
jgi:son of sevenless-like protein